MKRGLLRGLWYLLEVRDMAFERAAAGKKRIIAVVETLPGNVLSLLLLLLLLFFISLQLHTRA